MPFRRKPGKLTDAEIAEVQRWERDALKGFFAGQAGVDSGDDLWPSVERLVFASGPREVVAALEAHPVLLTDRADAALSATELFATMTQLLFAQGVLADRRAWIERLRDLRAGAGGSAPPDE